MKNRSSSLLWLSFLLLHFSCTKSDRSLTDYVDPFIGTDETDFVSLWRSEAGLYPGAVAPHGMVQLTPETQSNKEFLKGYFYKKDTIRRFSMTEHFSGWPNGSSGKGLFMPFISVDDGQVKTADLKSLFKHENEKASVGYYQVDLLDYEISCEFSTLVRSGIARFKFENDGKKGIAFSGFDSFEDLGNNQFRATLRAGRSEFIKANQEIFIKLEFDKDVRSEEVKSRRKSSWLIFPEDIEIDQLQFKVGLSYTAFENAGENLESEIPGWNLENVAKQARLLWEKELGRIELEGNEELKKTFYTALYHASLLPVNATDVNRQYPGFENSEPLGPFETHYIYFTPWDAFRTLHPLINFINPQKGKDYINSSLRFYDTYQRLPEPSVMTSVFMSSLYADAMNQGIKFDLKKAFKGLKELMIEKPYFRSEAMEMYDSLGFVPFPMRYATTATLEFAHNDWSLARIAERMGESELAEMLYRRSLNYRTQFDPATRFMKSKNPDGTFSNTSIYAEANKWNMSWFVPHDNQGLINLMGGNEAYCQFLNQNFEQGHFVLDNECPMNFAALFSYAERPDLSMKWTRNTLTKFFKNKPYGVPGNDDWGTMSSWFIWGSMGLFPAAPGSGELIITGPIFDKIKINRTDEEIVSIETLDASSENIYVNKAHLDNNDYNAPFVKFSDLINSKILFQMGSEPNFGFGNSDKPYSLTKNKPIFEVTQFSLSSSEVTANETFEVSATVSNLGETGSYKYEVFDEDSLVFSEYYLIDAGAEIDVKADLKLFVEGDHNIQVAENLASISVSSMEIPVAESIEFHAIEVDPLTHTSKNVNWSVSLRNISSKAIKYRPQIYLDNEEFFQLETITLLPGEIKELNGSFPANTLNGFYEFKINNSASSIFKVYQNSLEAVVVHYDFEAQGSKVIDQSGFENHGSIEGRASRVSGVEGSGISLNGGFISIPKSLSTEIENDEMTLMCWYRPVDQKGTAALITKGTFHMLKLNGKWQLKFAAGSWGRGQCFYNAKPDSINVKQPEWLNKWTHFAGVKDSKNIQIYVDGDRKNQLDHQGVLNSTEFEWRIGGNQEHPENRMARGSFDKVMIFASALSEQEIDSLFSSID